MQRHTSARSFSSLSINPFPKSECPKFHIPKRHRWERNGGVPSQLLLQGAGCLKKHRTRSPSQREARVCPGETVIIANGNSFSSQEERAGRRALPLQNGSASSIGEVRIPVFPLRPHLSPHPPRRAWTKPLTQIY